VATSAEETAAAVTVAVGATSSRPLLGKVALAAGATRGAGRAIAVELARAGAYVYATGRSSRETRPSDIDRPETIEETGDLMEHAGGEGAALRVDHLEPDQVADLVARIDKEQGRLDVLVNDIFGGDATPSETRSCGNTISTAACRCCAWGPHAPDHLREGAAADLAGRRRTGHRGDRWHDRVQQELS